VRDRKKRGGEGKKEKKNGPGGASPYTVDRVPEKGKGKKKKEGPRTPGKVRPDTGEEYEAMQGEKGKGSGDFGERGGKGEEREASAIRSRTLHL